MIYVKLNDYDGQLGEDECLLMSRDEFEAGGKDITGVPIAITPDGNEPIESENNEEING